MITLGTFDAKYLSAFTTKTGIQTMTTDGRGNYFVNGNPVSDEYIVRRILDIYNGQYTAILTAAGMEMRGRFERAAERGTKDER